MVRPADRLHGDDARLGEPAGHGGHDEPLYAFYLTATGLDHPGRDEVIASQPQRPGGSCCAAARRPAAARRDDRVPEAHDAPRAAVGGPVRVRAVPARVPDQGPALAARLLRAGPVRADPGRPGAAAAGGAVRGVRRPGASTRPTCSPRPRRRLRALCAALGVPFSAAMLSWPPGPRASDGVWAPYWYDSVGGRRVRARRRPGARRPALDPALEPLLDECLPYYEKLEKIRSSSIPNAADSGSLACCSSLTNATAT